jgi:ABC-type lipoprotein export system ATPase subunit
MSPLDLKLAILKKQNQTRINVDKSNPNLK